jgi:hypothetical protein
VSNPIDHKFLSPYLRLPQNPNECPEGLICLIHQLFFILISFFYWLFNSKFDFDETKVLFVKKLKLILFKIGIPARPSLMPVYVGLIVGDYVKPQVTQTFLCFLTLKDLLQMHVMFEELFDFVSAFIVIQSIYELGKDNLRNITYFQSEFKPYLRKIVFGVDDTSGFGFSKEFEMRNHIVKILMERYS